MLAHCVLLRPVSPCKDVLEVHPCGHTKLCYRGCKTAPGADDESLVSSPVLVPTVSPLISCLNPTTLGVQFTPHSADGGHGGRRRRPGMSKQQLQRTPSQRITRQKRRWPEPCWPHRWAIGNGSILCGNHNGQRQPRKELECRLCLQEDPSPFLLGLRPFTLIGHLPKL